MGPPLGKKTNQTGLPDPLKAGVESLSGIAMDPVKVINNSNQPAQYGAHAFTRGREIHLATGQERHLPHEAWHVVQQAQGRVKPTRLVAGRPINDSKSLEGEADRMGALAHRLGSTPGNSNYHTVPSIKSTPNQATRQPVSMDSGIAQCVLDSEDQTELIRRFQEIAQSRGQDPESPENQDHLREGIQRFEKLGDALNYLERALGNQFEPGEKENISDRKQETVISDEGAKRTLGFYMIDNQVGQIDDSVAIDSATNGVTPDNPPENLFVGSISSIPKEKGGKSPHEVAKLYRDEAFSPGGAAQQLLLSFGVNSETNLDGDGEKAVTNDVNSVTSWRDFGMRACGFIWHQWYNPSKEIAPIAQVRRNFQELQPIEQNSVREYQKTKKRQIPYGSVRSKTFEFTKKIASAKTRARNVWIHISDPDAQSLRSRSAEASGEEALNPLFTQYENIIKELEQELGLQALPPTVISGGYEFREKGKGGDVQESEFLTLLGHRLDVAMRLAIANADKQGNSAANTYLPEPNLLVKWENFLIQSQDIFGNDVKESLKMLKKYIKASRNNAIVRYDTRANIATKTDVRFRLDDETNLESMETSSKEFDPNKLTKDDIFKIVNQSQSYATYNHWVIPLAENFHLKGEALQMAFNACMITEACNYDPKKIVAKLDSFTVPTQEEINNGLVEKLGRKEEIRGEQRIKFKQGITIDLLSKVALQLNHAGNAMLEFMKKMFGGFIPDPIFEDSLKKMKTTVAEGKDQVV